MIHNQFLMQYLVYPDSEEFANYFIEVGSSCTRKLPILIK